MNIKKLGITCGLIFIIFFLFYWNIGLYISGPSRVNEKKDEKILEIVQKEYKFIDELYRHSFKYVTYSYVDESYAYVFDHDGDFVGKKEFSSIMFDEIKTICKDNYGLNDVDVHIGFGYDNFVFVVEEENIMIYFDYDSKEVVYYLRGDLV